MQLWCYEIRVRYGFEPLNDTYKTEHREDCVIEALTLDEACIKAFNHVKEYFGFASNHVSRRTVVFNSPVGIIEVRHSEVHSTDIETLADRLLAHAMID